jgi:hypothetical protein
MRMGHGCIEKSGMWGHGQGVDGSKDCDNFHCACGEMLEHRPLLELARRHVYRIPV